MYIIFNKDGSVREKQLADYVNQHSDGVNFIDIAIYDVSADSYTADGAFKLPNSDVVSFGATFVNDIKSTIGTFQGYRLTLNASVTEYQGDVALSIETFNAGKTKLFTYPVTIHVNETTGRGDSAITRDEYEALRAMMADYQLQYARSNMRAYPTRAEAEKDLDNLAEGQLFMAKETEDAENASVYAKMDGKIEMLSLDALSLDKYLLNKNAVGTGSFEWNVESKAYGYKNYFKITNGNQILLGMENGGTLPSFAFGSGIFRVKLDQYGVTYGAETPIYWSALVPNTTGKPYYLDSSLLGNKIATLGTDGKVPSSQLPSYVSDVREYASLDKFPKTGQADTIYIALDTNKTYRWGGTTYVEIGSSLALGETSETAWAGDKGKKNQEDIATLQTSKVSRVTNGIPPGYALYALLSSSGSATDTVLLTTKRPDSTTGVNTVPLFDTGAVLRGRSDQATNAPESDEFITKAYADTLSSTIIRRW